VNAGCVGEAKEGVVSVDGFVAHGARMENAFMREDGSCLKSRNKRK